MRVAQPVTCLIGLEQTTCFTGGYDLKLKGIYINPNLRFIYMPFFKSTISKFLDINIKGEVIKDI